MFCTQSVFSQINESNTGNFKTLPELNNEIVDYYTIKELKKPNFSMKSEHRLGHLLIVKFSFRATEDCTTLITPQSFMCTTIFRTGPKMAISRAIGTKKIPSGEIPEEKWFDSETTQLVYQLKKDETFDIYAVFEVPKKDVEEFEFYCLKTLADPFNL